MTRITLLLLTSLALLSGCQTTGGNDKKKKKALNEVKGKNLQEPTRNWYVPPIIRKEITLTIKEKQKTFPFKSMGDFLPYELHFFEVLEKLEKGEPVDINKPYEPGGAVPVSRAAARDPELAWYLLDKGADMYPKKSKSPLYNAVGNPRTIAVFLSFGIKFSNKDFQELESEVRSKPSNKVVTLAARITTVLTETCEALLSEDQAPNTFLDDAFFKYAKDKGVAESLLKQLKPRLKKKGLFS